MRVGVSGFGFRVFCFGRSGFGSAVFGVAGVNNMHLNVADGYVGIGGINEGNRMIEVTGSINSIRSGTVNNIVNKVGASSVRRPAPAKREHQKRGWDCPPKAKGNSPRESRPESGRDCLVRAMFCRQRTGCGSGCNLGEAAHVLLQLHA